MNWNVEGSGRELKALVQSFLGGTEKNHETISRDSMSPDCDSRPGPPKYEVGVLTITL